MSIGKFEMVKKNNRYAGYLDSFPGRGTGEFLRGITQWVQPGGMTATRANSANEAAVLWVRQVIECRATGLFS